MENLHITPQYNIKSILRNGILRNKPILPKYNDVMSYEYPETYDESKGLVFAIPETTNKRDKYIKDFTYWAVWGKIRNIYLKDTEDIIPYYDILEMGVDFFKDLILKENIFSVLLIDIPYEEVFCKYCHAQYPEMSENWMDMDIRYEHYSKPLTLINYDIKPENIKKEIGSCEIYFDKRNKIQTRLKI